MHRRTLLASTVLTVSSVTGCLDLLGSELDDAPPGVSDDGLDYELLIDHLIDHVRENDFAFTLGDGSWDAATSEPYDRAVRVVRADHSARRGVDMEEEYPDEYEGDEYTFIGKEYIDDDDASRGWVQTDPSVTIGEFDTMASADPEIEEFENVGRTFGGMIKRAVSGTGSMHQIPNLEFLHAGWPVDWIDEENFSTPQWDEERSRYVTEYTEDRWEGIILVDTDGYVRAFDRYREGDTIREAVFRFDPSVSEIEMRA